MVHKHPKWGKFSLVNLSMAVPINEQYFLCSRQKAVQRQLLCVFCHWSASWIRAGSYATGTEKDDSICEAFPMRDTHRERESRKLNNCCKEKHYESKTEVLSSWKVSRNGRNHWQEGKAGERWTGWRERSRDRMFVMVRENCLTALRFSACHPHL